MFAGEPGSLYAVQKGVRYCTSQESLLPPKACKANSVVSKGSSASSREMKPFLAEVGIPKTILVGKLQARFSELPR